jgi:ABC-type transport system involved in cytochrome bd biosynthesis fused ATPase/permease subunit
LSSSADAANAISRLYGVFEAELLADSYTIDHNLECAIEVKGAAFTWDLPPDNFPDSASGSRKRGPNQSTAMSKLEASKNAKESAEKAKTDEENVFRLMDVDFSIPRGQLVAIVGAVGSGKTSLLQGVIGEMRRTSGSITFGGSVAYSSQSAWIQVNYFFLFYIHCIGTDLVPSHQNATIRENVCFGRPFEEARYWNAVRDSCLEPDLDALPNGDLTEVGERVISSFTSFLAVSDFLIQDISLSGGQKQRVNICRAIYCNTDIQIFDVRVRPI